MAARTARPEHKAEVRERIKASQLLNRLHKNALQDECMTQGQIKSAEILLRKALPDLANVTLTGDPNNPVAIQTIERRIVRAKAGDSDS